MLDDDAGRRSLRDRRLRRRRPARAPVVAQVRAARLRHPGRRGPQARRRRRYHYYYYYSTLFFSFVKRRLTAIDGNGFHITMERVSVHGFA